MSARLRGLATLLAAALATACGGGDADSARPSPASPAGASVAVAAAPDTGSTGPTCPADGRWHPCSVIKRLEMSGLVLRDTTEEVAEPPLTVRGTSYMVGNSTLTLFFYPDERARAADQARLDPGRYIDASQPLSMRAEVTRIGSANLLALLRSRNDHQRERVSDALTAGPPQAERTTP